MFDELGALVDEVRLSFHAFSEFARRTHGARIDPSGRAVLEYLSKNPRSSVPAVARARGVTRQHIQTIVNALESEGLVEAFANPHHKRSPVFAPTPAGTALMQSITETEQALLEPLGVELDPDRLAAAVATLTTARTLLARLEDVP